MRKTVGIIRRSLLNGEKYKYFNEVSYNRKLVTAGANNCVPLFLDAISIN